MHFAYNCSTCNKCYQIQSYEYKFFKKQFKKNYLFHLEFLFNFNEFSFWNEFWQPEPWKSVNEGYVIIMTNLPVCYLFVILDLPWAVSVVYLPLSAPSPPWAPGLLMDGRAVISALYLQALGLFRKVPRQPTDIFLKNRVNCRALENRATCTEPVPAAHTLPIHLC